MEVYTTEEERLEAVQRWWKENSQSVTVGLLLGAAAIFGWNMWHGNREATSQQASNLYQQMVLATENKQTDSALKLGERIISQYGSTAYSGYARMLLAKINVNKGSLPEARKALEEELAKTSNEDNKHIVRLRLGRVMLASGDINGGLKLIEPYTGTQPGKFGSIYDELRGDFYAASKRPEDARAAYLKAKELGEPNPMLELKLNDLPAAATAH